MRKTTWFLLGVLLAVALAWSTDAKADRTPVVQYAADGILVQTGWQEYEKVPGLTLLFCVKREDRVLLDCVGYFVAKDGAAVAVIPNVSPSST